MKLFRRLLDLIYPPRCPFCGRVLNPGEEGLCSLCQTKLPWVEKPGKPVDFCEGCLSPLWYREGVRRAVHSYKFRGGRDHGRLFAMLMTQALKDQWEDPVDVIVWVPLSRRHLRRRGYDQAEFLARRIGELTGVAVSPALTKLRETLTQSRQTGPSARRANVLGAYGIADPEAVEGKRVLLVDDVCTSGATLSECAACLLMAGAKSVVGLTFARAGE